MLALRAETPDWDVDGADWPHRAFSRFVVSDGIRFHVQVMGDTDAPPVVLIHGTGGSLHSWRDVMPELASNHHVIAMDLPGHGFTTGARPSHLSLDAMARTLAQLFRKLDIGPDMVIGHSAGAAIALKMAMDGFLPGSALVGLNAALQPIEGNHLLSPLAKLLFLNPMTSRIVSLQARLGGMSRSLIRATGSQIDAIGEQCYALLMRHPAHVNGAIGMMARWDLVPLGNALPKLTAPVLLIAAHDDPMVPANVSRDAAHRLPAATLRIFGSGGHLLHEVDARGVVRTILEWKGALP